MGVVTKASGDRYIAPAVNVYMQAVTNQYLEILLQRDEVTSKQLFQFIFDYNLMESNEENEA